MDSDSKLTLSFSRDKSGYFFYPPNKNQVIFEKARAKEEIKVEDEKGVEKKASWKRPLQPYLYDNVYKLLEHPKLSQILVKRANFINIFRANKSKEAKDTLETFMDNIMDVLVEILKVCHETFWLYTDLAIPVRSQYDFNYCLNTAINFGFEKLKIKNLVVDITDPYAISKSQLENQQTDIMRNVNKQLGKPESDVMKKRGRKNKKNK